MGLGQDGMPLTNVGDDRKENKVKKYEKLIQKLIQYRRREEEEEKVKGKKSHQELEEERRRRNEEDDGNQDDGTWHCPNNDCDVCSMVMPGKWFYSRVTVSRFLSG